MRLTKLSIIIPVYNEVATVRLILDRIKAVELIAGIQKEFVLYAYYLLLNAMICNLILMLLVF